jgi:hypothetical protein
MVAGYNHELSAMIQISTARLHGPGMAGMGFLQDKGHGTGLCSEVGLTAETMQG